MTFSVGSVYPKGVFVITQGIYVKLITQQLVLYEY